MGNIESVVFLFEIFSILIMIAIGMAISVIGMIIENRKKII